MGELLEAMLAQLFVDTSTNNLNGVSLPGSRLAAEARAELGWGDFDSSEWELQLNLESEVIDAVFDLLAQRGPRFRNIVTAARDPESPAGVARRAALKEWSKYFETQGWSRYFQPQAWQQQVE